MSFLKSHLTRRVALALGLGALVAATLPGEAEAQVSEIRIDWATYNPVSLILKEQGLLEEALEADGIGVRWVQSHGSNRALEFLNAGSIDFGSTAGAAALVGRINGNPIKSIYVYSRPEWTALVTAADSDIQEPADLAGKSVAVTRGTDPHIFLIQALANHGLGEGDVRFVLLQHQDGAQALRRGDVDAWAGLDPMMAAAEVEDGARLFYRRPELNSWGVLNVREAFAAENPELVERVLTAYEEARQFALDNPDEVADALRRATRLPEEVIARQLERTELTHSRIGAEQSETILAAGNALQEAGVIGADVDVAAHVEALIDESLSVAAQ